MTIVIREVGRAHVTIVMGLERPEAYVRRRTERECQRALVLSAERSASMRAKERVNARSCGRSSGSTMPQLHGDTGEVMWAWLVVMDHRPSDGVMKQAGVRSATLPALSAGPDACVTVCYGSRYSIGPGEVAVTLYRIVRDD